MVSHISLSSQTFRLSSLTQLFSSLPCLKGWEVAGDIRVANLSNDLASLAATTRNLFSYRHAHNRRAFLQKNKRLLSLKPWKAEIEGEKICKLPLTMVVQHKGNLSYLIRWCPITTTFRFLSLAREVYCSEELSSFCVSVCSSSVFSAPKFRTQLRLPKNESVRICQFRQQP